MTPKEKALQLIQRFRSINFTTGKTSKMIASYEDCKQCALICCDEVLGDMGADRGYEFWTAVKEEINKL